MNYVEQFNFYGFTPSVVRLKCTFLAFKANVGNLSLHVSMLLNHLDV
jgi:hypothetical protein